MPSLSSTWWRKLINHLACPTGSQVTPCSWSQEGRWQGLALNMKRHHASRKRQGLLEAQQLLQPQTAVPQDTTSPPHAQSDCPWKSDSAKFWETYPNSWHTLPYAGPHLLLQQHMGVHLLPGTSQSSGWEGFCGNIWTWHENVPPSAVTSTSEWANLLPMELSPHLCGHPVWARITPVMECGCLLRIKPRHEAGSSGFTC